ncbi:MAG: thiamine pyrophosphate-binding protein [Candidatus Latescibacterota bacterium]
MIEASRLLQELKANGVSHVVGVPDNGSRALFELAWADPGMCVVLVTREGEAISLASGLYVGGRQPLVLIQNTGLLESGDAFRGTAYNMGLPLVMLVGYRGLASLEPGALRIDTAATFLEPTLKAWSIPYYLLRTSADSPLISAAFATAAATSLPTAVIYPGEMV